MKKYKTKATAIKHVHAGENFWTCKFSDFWENKEVVKEAIVKNPYGVFDHPQCGAKEEWRWDEDFMTEVFDRIVNLQTHGAFFGWEGTMYLPPSITTKKHLVLKAFAVGMRDICLYIDESMYGDQDIISSMPRTYGTPALHAYPLGMRLDKKAQALRLTFTQEDMFSGSGVKFYDELSQADRSSLAYWQGLNPYGQFAGYAASYDIRKVINLYAKGDVTEGLKQLAKVQHFKDLEQELDIKVEPKKLMKV